jgi:hypothetical protein
MCRSEYSFAIKQQYARAIHIADHYAYYAVKAVAYYRAIAHLCVGRYGGNHDCA